jgi:hypothetical protein
LRDASLLRRRHPPPPPPPYPGEPFNITVYHVNEQSYGAAPLDMNTADLNGDMFFVRIPFLQVLWLSSLSLDVT